MKKLRRYHYAELANTYLEDAIPDNKVYCRPKDVSALEAENERLREAIETALVDIAHTILNTAAGGKEQKNAG